GCLGCLGRVRYGGGPRLQFRSAVAALPKCSGDEVPKQRMCLRRLGFELRMELDRDKPGGVSLLHDLDDHFVRAGAAGDEAALLEIATIIVVDLVTMSMTLVNSLSTIRLGGLAARSQNAGP